ncbi:MAG: hypothetical protein KDE32_15900 [Novosphingobium sp.]|nr:hypothetical protein [Novosphingobium sp.]
MSGLNPYFLGCAAMVAVALFVFVMRQSLWALPFAGAALGLFFLGMSQEADDGDGDARR